MIHIVGLGPGKLDQITLESYRLLTSGLPLYLRTAVHPAAAELTAEGREFEAFDAVYDSAAAFETVYQTIVSALTAKAADGGELIYAVPGNPLCAETTVQLLMAQCREQGIAYRVYPAVSFIDAVMTAIETDPAEGMAVIDAFLLDEQPPEPQRAALITQVYDRHMAGEVKLKLSDIYDDETEVMLVINAGIPESQSIHRIPLYEIDRVPEINHLTSLYIPAQPENLRDFGRLTDIIRTLRSPGGCPWDRAQTHESLKTCLLEEVYEVLDAIDNQDTDNLIEELGDVLMNLLLHGVIGEEEGLFSVNDVIEGVAEKMIRRHPHVFGAAQADSAEGVITLWNEIKKQEKQNDPQREKHPMEKIPKSFTALMRSDKIQAKAAKVGFDWDDPMDALDKVFEEAAEVRQAYEKEDRENLIEEIGDLFFAAVNVARLCKTNSELALNAANDKFIRRYIAMEELAKTEGKVLTDYDLPGMDALWNRVKQQ